MQDGRVYSIRSYHADIILFQLVKKDSNTEYLISVIYNLTFKEDDHSGYIKIFKR